MNETEFRILDVLAREIGNSISINKLTEKIKQIHGTAHYTNIHAELQNITKKKITKLTKLGKATITKLNFDNYLVIDHLSEMELIKKIKVLENNSNYQLIISDLNILVKDLFFVKFVLLAEPDRNIKLNRMDIVWILRSLPLVEVDKEIDKIHNVVQKLQRIHNIKIDCLFLYDEKFVNLLKMDDANMIKEMLFNKIVLFHPQIFWMEIKEISSNGTYIKIEEYQTHPGKIRDIDLSFNLARFGYTEMGTKISSDAKSIGIEYIITSILVKKDNVRKLEAIPIILAKNNEKINYPLLMFLASKFQVTRQIYNILKILDVLKPTKEVQSAIKEMFKRNMQKTKEQKMINFNLKDVKKKMRLYNVLE